MSTAPSDLSARLATLLAERDAAPASAAPPAPTAADESRVLIELDRERARREAHRRLAAEERGRPAIPEILTLRDRLARPGTPSSRAFAIFNPPARACCSSRPRKPARRR